jgi:hypothetical protein
VPVLTVVVVPAALVLLVLLALLVLELLQAVQALLVTWPMSTSFVVYDANADFAHSTP